MTIHTSTYQGKRVFVKLKDGTSFVAKFKDSKSGRVMFIDHDPITTNDILSMTIFRHQTNS